MKLEFPRKIIEKYSNIKFHETAPSGSRVVACGQTERQTDRQTDMTKLSLFTSFANVPKKQNPNCKAISSSCIQKIIGTTRIWKPNAPYNANRT